MEVEIHRIDELAANPNAKLILANAIAERLQTHRNHLMLLRRETGQSYGQIFVSLLEAAGKGQDEIVRELRAVIRNVEKELDSYRSPEAGSRPPRPRLFLASSVDHDSVGTFYSLTPEVGIDTKHFSFVAGIPYYRNWETQLSNGGLGDAYATAFARGRISRYDLGSSFTVGLPTGDRMKGLGAGEVTFDVTGSVSRRFEVVQPFLSGGFTNSVFGNVGYLRPYVSTGNAAHVSGGIDIRVVRRLTIGLGGFALRPLQTQTIYSRMIGNTPALSSSGPMPGDRTPGMGSSVSNQQPGSTAGVPFFQHGQHTEVTAEESQDHGANVWASFMLHPGVSLNFTAARSIPFRLTTVRFGLGIEMGRLLFPGKHF